MLSGTKLNYISYILQHARVVQTSFSFNGVFGKLTFSGDSTNWEFTPTSLQLSHLQSLFLTSIIISCKSRFINVKKVIIMECMCFNRLLIELF